VSRWLVDTNVLSELRRERPPAALERWLAGSAESDVCISVVTLAELRFGIERVGDVGKRAVLGAWLEDVRRHFDGRVLPLNEDVLVRWRVLIDETRKRGITLGEPDAMIAATALHFRCGVVTRDVRGFQATGVMLFDPWHDDAPPGAEPS